MLGFSRSGKFINKEFLNAKCEMYTLDDVDTKNIQETIQNHAKDPEKIKSIFQKIKQIGLNQILFVMQILEHQEKDFENITTASDLFLTILQGNLAFHYQKGDTGFSKLLKGENQDFFLKNTFKVCKENLQNTGKDEDDNSAGVFVGTLTDDVTWESDASRIKVPLNFLKTVGIFEIPPPSYESLTLTAQHLSFVEFFASVGILLSSDIEAELDKIENLERVRAVCFYIRNDLLSLNLV